MPKQNKSALMERLAIDRPELDFILKKAVENASQDQARLQNDIDMQLNVTRVLCVILYSCGLRLNEALALTRPQLAALVSGNTVKVFTSKCNKTRDIAFSTAAQQLWADVMPANLIDTLPVLSDLPPRKDGKPHGVLTNSQGTAPLQERTAQRYLEPLFEALAQHKFRMSNRRDGGCFYGSHSFRIGYITRVVNHTGSLDAASAVIGHSNLATTKRYYRGGEKQAEANKRLLASNPNF